VSLSTARRIDGGIDGTGLFQIEPLLHKECAAISLQHCPYLRQRLADGTLPVRQVTRYDVRLSVMLPEAIAEHVPEYTGPREGIVGYAQIRLLAWTDRDAAWLGS
jgi:hypothetical protein